MTTPTPLSTVDISTVDNSGLWVDPEEIAPYLTNPNDYAEAIRVAQDASYYMWALSGRKYRGRHIVTETYTLDSVSAQCRLVPPFVSTSLNQYSNMPTGYTYSQSGVHLNRTPVYRILEVVREDTKTIVDPSEYVLLSRSVLGQTSVCSWSNQTPLTITYIYGASPPSAGIRAATRLAQELIYSYQGNDDCQLPKRVTQVNRQGLSFTLLDPLDFLDNGRTGISDIDMFLKVANPAKALKRARIFSTGQHKAVTKSSYSPKNLGKYQDIRLAPGMPQTFAYQFQSQGVNVPINGYYNVDAKVTLPGGGTYSLLPYLSIESGGQTGNIVLTLPSSFAVRGMYNITLSLKNDPTSVVKLVYGKII